jgi:serine/threonine protein kinase
VNQYELYCLTDSLFYDRSDKAGTDISDFPLVRRPLPEDWGLHESDTWMYYSLKDGGGVPAQGWKIHLSARLEQAEDALAIMWDYCVTHRIAFKFLRSPRIHVLYNAKSASRSSGGKLATIYPRDTAELRRTVEELDALLEGVKGPYVLSDLRYGKGPLYLRYGGFAERRCLAENGERVLALEDGEGRLVPDVRGSVFSVPPWTTLPDFLEPHLAARNSVTITDLPYDIESVLHFSNGGGVYLGRSRATGERVVLKEGRPYAGLDTIGRDAQERLRHERDILRRLEGLDVVPALLDYFTLGEHEFLVQEFIDGNPLQRRLVQRYPLTHADCSAQDITEYTEWATGVLERVDRAVTALHERDVVFGDLHPDNILLTADGALVLIDFEVATRASDQSRSTLAHPAFVAPRDRHGFEVDRYALACLSLGLFAPQATIMLPLHRAKVDRLATIITETFPVSRTLIDDAVRIISGPTPQPEFKDPQAAPKDQPAGRTLEDLPAPGEAPWSEVRDALHRAILASATPDREDRLFPGDVAQFEPGGMINLAHGAAGVLYALAETGAEPIPEYESLLAKRAMHTKRSGLGLYDGLHGVAYVLNRLGQRQPALDLADICLRERWEELGLDLYSGLSGIGLTLLHLDPAFAEMANRAVELCAERIGGPQDVPEISGGDNPRAGLMHGSSGPALLFLHAYERNGDTALLGKAADALRQDLRRCIRSADGSLQVNQGWRFLPYLAEGSVGIALVLARYLRHRPEDEEFVTALADLRSVGQDGYFVQSGLFTGRAGIIAALAAGLRPGQDGPDPLLDEQIRGLRWHALPYGGGLAFPGDQLLRLSMDLATGSAGVLLALGASYQDRPAQLPFLEPSADTPRPHGSSGGRHSHRNSVRPNPDESREEV